MPPMKTPPRRSRDWEVPAGIKRGDRVAVAVCFTLLVWLLAAVALTERLTPRPGGRRFGGDESGVGPVQDAQGQRNGSGAGTVAGLEGRVSGLGPKLSDAALHGGWKFTPEVFNWPTKYPNATVVSWASPRALHVRNFLQPREVAALIQAAGQGFRRSEVVSDSKALDEGRTSYGAWLNGPSRTATVLEVQHRIAELTGIPEEFGESIHVLRYAAGQKYEAHTDHCRHVATEQLTPACRGFLQRGGGAVCGPGGGGVTCGDRLATVILYLQSPSKGGATVFTQAKHNNSLPGLTAGSTRAAAGSQQRHLTAKKAATGSTSAAPWYCQPDANVLKVLPAPGDAVLFYDYVPGKDPEGLAQADPASLHAGCPPLKGTKLIATRWMRAAEFL